MRGTIERRVETFRGREGDDVEYEAAYLVGDDGSRQRIDEGRLRLPQGAAVELEPVPALGGKPRVEVRSVAV